MGNVTDSFRLASIFNCPTIREKALKIFADKLEEVKETEGGRMLEHQEVQQILGQMSC